MSGKTILQQRKLWLLIACTAIFLLLLVQNIYAIDFTFHVKKGGKIEIPWSAFKVPSDYIRLTVWNAPQYGRLTRRIYYTDPNTKKKYLMEEDPFYYDTVNSRIWPGESLMYYHNGSADSTDRISFSFWQGLSTRIDSTLIISTQGINHIPKCANGTLGEISEDDYGLNWDDRPFINNFTDEDVEDILSVVEVNNQSKAGGSVSMYVAWDNSYTQISYNTNGVFNYLKEGEVYYDEIYYKVDDGDNGIAWGIAKVKITGINDAPQATAVTANGLQNTDLTITLNGTDPEKNALTYKIVSLPSKGKLYAYNNGARGNLVTSSSSITGDKVIFAPNTNEYGDNYTSFTFKISDGKLDSNTNKVTINIKHVNQVPQATSPTLTGLEDVDLPITLPASDVDKDPLTYIIANLPTKGKLFKVNGTARGDEITAANTNLSDNKVIFVPALNENGNNYTSFQFLAFDKLVYSNTATVTINITPVNDLPVVTDKTLTGIEDTDIAITLTGTDVESDPLTYTIAALPSKGTLFAVTADGKKGAQITAPNTALTGNQVIYTPAPNGNGNNYSSFQYKAKDKTDYSSPGTVTISITPVYDPPVVADNSVTGFEDTDLPIILDVTNPDGSPLTYTLLSLPLKGTFFTVANGSKGTPITAPNIVLAGNQVIFVPLFNENGNNYAAFQFKVSDGTTETSVSTITINITPVDDKPIAKDITVTGAADTDIPIILDATDIDSTTVYCVISTIPSKGKIWIATDGKKRSLISNPGFAVYGIKTLIYSSNDQTVGNFTDTFTYWGYNTNRSEIATVTLNVKPPNHPPVAKDDTVATYQDHPVIIPVLNNDSDPDGDSLKIKLSPYTTPHGSTTYTDTDITYTPKSGFSGSDTFIYLIADPRGKTSQAKVTVTVYSLLTASINPVEKGTIGTVFNLTSSVSGGTGTYTYQWAVSDAPAGATTELTTPSSAATSFSASMGGVYTVSLTVNDGMQPAITKTVQVSINRTPAAVDDVIVTYTGHAITIPVLSNDSDPDGDALTIQSTVQPANGVAANTASDITYTPNSGFSGTDTFNYAVADSKGATAQAKVTVTVYSLLTASINPVEKGTIGTVFNLTSSVSGGTGTYTYLWAVSEAPAGATTELTTPSSAATSFSASMGGVYTVFLTVNDGMQPAITQTVNVTINQPPVAVDDTAVTYTGQTITIPVMSNDTDPDGDTLTIQSTVQPANGVVTNTASDITYTPNSGFSGSDTFNYAVADSKGATAQAKVTVTVYSLLTASINPVEPGTIGTVFNLTSSVSGGTGTYTYLWAVSDAPAGATTELTTPSSAATSFSALMSGNYTLSLTVNDGIQPAITQTVLVPISLPMNQTPVAVDDTAVTYTGQTITIPVMSNDTDPDGDTLTIQSVEQPANGVVTNTALDITYTPNSGFSGTDTFNYAVADSKGATAQAKVTVTVYSLLTASINPVEKGTIGTVFNLTSSVSGGTGTYSYLWAVSEAPAGATTELTTPSSATTSFSASMSGNYTLSLTVNDGIQPAITQTALVPISLPMNQTPVAVDDTIVTYEGHIVTIPVLNNDSDPDGDTLTIQSTVQPANGVITNTASDITYTPNSGFSGTDTFNYAVADSKGATAQANVAVTIYPLLTVGIDPVSKGTVSTVFQLKSTVQGGTGIYTYLWSVTSSPQDATKEITSQDAATALFSASLGGVYTISLTVNDGMQPPKTQTVPIGINREPVFTANPWTAAEENTPYIYNITVSDPDNDPLTLSLITAPSWLSLVKNDDGSTNLTGTPPALPEGTSSQDYDIVISVSDGMASVTQEFTLTEGKSSTAFPPVTVSEWALY